MKLLILKRLLALFRKQALGLIGAFALTRVVESLWFEVSALDAVVLGIACVAMFVVGLFATLRPATRAAGVQPMAVLRDEG